MVNDRGSIKWTSLMLPEHVELLRGIHESNKKVTKPILDEQEIEHINQQLIHADEQGSTIEVSVYEDGIIQKYSGSVQINKMEKTIKLNRHTFSFENILSVE
ncbi:YolD-like protein [Oceanobacillus limi]|uniref:YolD-like protein n=1 Tax=Oceanobacillus limi TaxID=930131 RepID=A0A1H9ZC27_9BACI|nr:YolD-like family protein [Oceanobacillus limi]SES79135.1 YolD-like protein [Oceanobacillus limi]